MILDRTELSVSNTRQSPLVTPFTSYWYDYLNVTTTTTAFFKGDLIKTAFET